jgi:uncharacterized surface protein with fasciclin (FAS1) repeats
MSMPELSTFLTFAKHIDWLTTVSGNGPFTVFAPTNAAFAILPSTVRTSLLATEQRPQLRIVLSNHAANGSIRSSDLALLSTLASLSGQALSVTRQTNEFIVAGARVVTADLTCSNGVVHVIDRVIIHSQSPTPTRPPPDRGLCRPVGDPTPIDDACEWHSLRPDP